MKVIFLEFVKDLYYTVGRKEGAALERNMMTELIKWRNLRADRMPLVLYGVRQVGKT